MIALPLWWWRLAYAFVVAGWIAGTVWAFGWADLNTAFRPVDIFGGLLISTAVMYRIVCPHVTS